MLEDEIYNKKINQKFYQDICSDSLSDHDEVEDPPWAEGVCTSTLTILRRSES